MSSEFTFIVEKICPACGRSTRVVKVKSRLAGGEIDSDYCCHYRDFNPYLYHIWVCEYCGFAADEKVFLSAMPMVHREAVGNALVEKHVHFEFHEVRSVPDGIASLKLAMYCAEVLSAPLARQAGLAMRLAWVYRLDGQKEKEQEAMGTALNLYIRSLENERYPIENLTDNMVMYLIGALYAQLGENKKAVLYLSRLVEDRRGTAGEPKLVKDARKLWQQVREEEQEKQPEQPAETEKKATLAKKSAAPKKKSGLRRWF